MDNVDGKTLGISFFNIANRISKSALPESSKNILVRHLKATAEKTEKYKTKSLDYDAWVAFTLVKIFEYLLSPTGQDEFWRNSRNHKSKK